MLILYYALYGTSLELPSLFPLENEHLASACITHILPSLLGDQAGNRSEQKGLQSLSRAVCVKAPETGVHSSGKR